MVLKKKKRNFNNARKKEQTSSRREIVQKAILKEKKNVNVPPPSSSKTGQLVDARSNYIPSHCSQFSTTTYTVDANHVACISLKKINELLDRESAEVCPGVFVAPLFRGTWGAFAQIQIEPKKSHGPYLNTAQFMVGRIVAGAEEASLQSSPLEISINRAPGLPLNQDGYFQIPLNTIYTLHNKSSVHPVVISLQLFGGSRDETKCPA